MQCSRKSRLVQYLWGSIMSMRGSAYWNKHDKGQIDIHSYQIKIWRVTEHMINISDESTIRNLSCLIWIRETKGTYFWQTGSVDDHFKVLGHLLDEVFCAWAFHHKDLLCSSIDIDWDNVVWLWDLSELTVHECLVKVQNERFPSPNVLRLGPKKPIRTHSLSISVIHHVRSLLLPILWILLVDLDRNRGSVRRLVWFEFEENADLNLVSYFISFVCYLLLFKSHPILQI